MHRSISQFLHTDLIVIEADASLGSLEARLDRPVDYGVPVVGAGGQLRGVITPTDLLRVNIQAGASAQDMPARSVCRRIRASLTPDASLRRAQRLMLTRDLDSILVMDSARHLVGMIFRCDLEQLGLLPARSVRWRRPTQAPSGRRSTETRRSLYKDQPVHH